MPLEQHRIHSSRQINGSRHQEFLPQHADGSHEYMPIPVKDIPLCIMEQYQLHDLVHNGYVLVEIRKGMYGLP
jgi:hypothetical protein